MRGAAVDIGLVQLVQRGWLSRRRGDDEGQVVEVPRPLQSYRKREARAGVPPHGFGMGRCGERCGSVRSESGAARVWRGGAAGAPKS